MRSDRTCPGSYLPFSVSAGSFWAILCSSISFWLCCLTHSLTEKMKNKGKQTRSACKSRKKDTFGNCGEWKVQNWLSTIRNKYHLLLRMLVKKPRRRLLVARKKRIIMLKRMKTCLMSHLNMMLRHLLKRWLYSDKRKSFSKVYIARDLFTYSPNKTIWGSNFMKHVLIHISKVLSSFLSAYLL